MTAVVHELVHIHAVEDRSGALFGADEIDAEQQQEPGEHDPWKGFAKRDRGEAGGRREMRGRVHAAIILREFASPCETRLASGAGLAFGRRPITVARPRRISAGFRCLKRCARTIVRGMFEVSIRAGI